MATSTSHITTKADAARRLGELMLYVAKKSEEDPHFGAVKLNKILFFSDLLAFAKLGKAISGEQYQKLDQGPAPKRLLPVRKGLESRFECAVKKVARFGREQQRLIALREPDLSLFTGEEIAIVDEIIEALRPANAAQVSHLSHECIEVWKGLKDKEVIPLEIGLVRARPLTTEESRHGLGLEPSIAC